MLKQATGGIRENEAWRKVSERDHEEPAGIQCEQIAEWAWGRQTWIITSITSLTIF